MIPFWPCSSNVLQIEAFVSLHLWVRKITLWIIIWINVFEVRYSVKKKNDFINDFMFSISFNSRGGFHVRDLNKTAAILAWFNIVYTDPMEL